MAAKQEGKTEAKPNRKQRREQNRRIWTDNPGLEVVHPDAAGIDIGNREHYVAIAPGKSEMPVRKFGCFTHNLRELAEFPKAHGIRSVAMQSTGVYWIPLYMGDFKAYAGRRLHRMRRDEPSRKRWAHHGSTRWLWKPPQVPAAMQYVVAEPGEAMSVFESEEL